MIHRGSMARDRGGRNRQPCGTGRINIVKRAMVQRDAARNCGSLTTRRKHCPALIRHPRQIARPCGARVVSGGRQLHVSVIVFQTRVRDSPRRRSWLHGGDCGGRSREIQRTISVRSGERPAQLVGAAGSIGLPSRSDVDRAGVPCPQAGAAQRNDICAAHSLLRSPAGPQPLSWLAIIEVVGSASNG